MELTKDEIRDIALLARIGVTDQEVVMYQKDLSAVLQYFDKLQEVNTDQIEEIGHITGVTNMYREDIVIDTQEEEKQRIMDNMSDVYDGHIKVKSVL